MLQPAFAWRKQLPLLSLAVAVAVPIAACGEATDEDMASVTPGPTGTGPMPTDTGTVPPPSPTPPASTVAPMPTPPATVAPTPPATVAPEPTMPPEPVGEPEPTGPVRSTDGPSYATTLAPIFEEKCAPSCHEPGGLLGGSADISNPSVKMDLTAAAGYATLTAGMAVQLPTMWVVGDSTESSYLWHKLQGTHMDIGGLGAKMPVTGSLTEEEMAAVQAWIEGGASP